MTPEEQAREIVEACRLQVRINQNYELSTVEPDKAREAITAVLSEKDAEIERWATQAAKEDDCRKHWQARAEAAESLLAEARKVIEQAKALLADCVPLLSGQALADANQFLSTPSPEPSKDGATLGEPKPHLMRLSDEELDRREKQAREDAHNAPKNLSGSSRAYADRASDWFDIRDEQRRRAALAQFQRSEGK